MNRYGFPWLERPRPFSNRAYHSATHGKIPLSKEAKGLMQSLRHAIVAAIGVGDYRAHRQAIAHARGELALYISKLEGNKPVYEPANDIADLDSANPFRDLAMRTTDVARTHGREAVLALLRKHGCERLSSLSLARVTHYTQDLEKLAASLTPAEIERSKAEEAFQAARTRSVHRPFASNMDRDRAVFDAGRAYEKGQK